MSLSRLMTPIIIILFIQINILYDENSCKADNKTIYVDDSGGSDYLKIQDAINSANESDTIYVYAGSYSENIIINKSISLIGAGYGYTFIYGDKIDHTVKIYSDQVEISGFNIQNERASFSSIFLKSISDCIIRDNIVSKSGNGIYLINSKENIINNNLIEKNNIGIYLSNSDINYVKSNVIKNNNANGILINSESNNNIIYLNHFSNNIVNNARDLSSNNWNRNAYGNFWDDYNDYDNNGDGIGDNPYIIDSNSKDFYPLGYFLTTSSENNDDLDPNNNYTEDMLDDLFNESNIFPIAKILKINPKIIDYGQIVTFEGLGKDSDGFISEYLWTSNIDGVISRKAIFEKSTLSAGNHDIFFKVKDNYGDWSKEVKSSITVNKVENINNKLPVANTGGPYYGFIDENIEFDGSKSSDPDGDEIISYLWNFNDGKTANGEKVFHSFNKVGNYTILLTITDINGGESTKSTYSLISEKINDEIIENSSKENSFPFLYVIIIFLIIVGSIVFIKYRGSDK